MKIRVLCQWERMGYDGSYASGSHVIDCTITKNESGIFTHSAQAVKDHLEHYLKEEFGDDATYMIEVISFEFVPDVPQPKSSVEPVPSRLSYAGAAAIGGGFGLLIAKVLDEFFRQITRL